MAEAKGILGTKLGMTQIFTEDSRAVPVTVIQAGPCVVTQVKTTERDGYEAVQLAFAETRSAKAHQADGRPFRRRPGSSRARHVVELRTDGRVRLRSSARRSRSTSSSRASTPTSSASPRARASPAR